MLHVLPLALLCRDNVLASVQTRVVAACYTSTMHTVRRNVGQGTAATLLSVMHVRYILLSKYEHTRVRHLRCGRDLTNTAQPRHKMHTFETTSSKCSFFFIQKEVCATENARYINTNVCICTYFASHEESKRFINTFSTRSTLSWFLITSQSSNCRTAYSAFLISARLQAYEASSIDKSYLSFEIKHETSRHESIHVSKHLMLIQKHTAGMMTCSLLMCICLKCCTIANLGSVWSQLLASEMTRMQACHIKYTLV